MRVHLVYTGGTLGMVETSRGLAPGSDLAGWLDRLLADTDLADATTLSSFDRLLDSSNITPEDWQAIADHLLSCRDEADGFVVLHGTDTMAYTSSALSFALTGFGKPVVLTGAQYPIGVMGSDAAPNVTGALRAASSGRFAGVAIFFGHLLLAGGRSTKASSWAFPGFESPGVPPLAVAGAPWRWAVPAPGGCGWPDPAPFRRQDVIVLDLVPGMTAARLAVLLTPRPAGVILRVFGVGNLPSEEPGLSDVIRDTITAGVPLVVASQVHQSQVVLGRYEAGRALAEAGALSAGDMTLEATYAKLVFLLSQGLEPGEIARWMQTNIAGELTEP